MTFPLLDTLIVAMYLGAVTIAGIVLSGRQRSATDYFLGGRSLPWWLVGLSIVAGETSALTIISVPGIAYTGSMRFMQLVAGYFCGRLLVSVVFIPAYFRGTLETAYDFLGGRYGMRVRRLMSTTFIVTRVLASGVRLFATAIPVHMITGLSYPASIALIGIFTLVYTGVGGLKAVVTMDAVQLAVYLCGAGVAFALIISRIPGGWTAVTANGDKFALLNPLWPASMSFASIASFLAAPYTLLGGLIGGTFLSMASHGTDQLLVQRLLGCRSKRDAQKALLLDATLIVLQFGFFLLLGIALFAYHRGASLESLGLQSPDEIFPHFIIHELPSGISGLMVAGLIASAMGTLSSSISSLASSSYLDVIQYIPFMRESSPRTELRWSRGLTVFWGFVLIGGAMLFTDSKNPVVEIGLKIASFTYGGLLGVFFLGLLPMKTEAPDATAGFVVGVLTMTWIVGSTGVNFAWHTAIGAVSSVTSGLVLYLIRVTWRRSSP
jgi:SSS family transporter